MKNLSKLTVIIPSMNRQKLGLSTMNYWSKFNVKLHFVDGSENRIEDSNLSMFNENIRYHHFNIFSEIDRVKKILHLIDTKYCILGSDDDVLLPNALSKCIDVLEKENDFSCCFGQVLGFKYLDDKYMFYENNTNLKDFSLDSDNKEDRLKKYSLKPVPFSIFSVMKSEIFKKVCDVDNFTEISYFAAFELRANLLTTYFGKSKAISYLTLLRNKNSNPVRNRNSKNTSLFRFLFSKEKRIEKNLFISSLLKTVSKDDKNAEKIFKKALLYNLVFSFFRFFSKKIPNILFSNIKFLYKYKRKKKFKTFVSIENLSNFCKIHRIEIFDEDLKLILEKFNKIIK